MTHRFTLKERLFGARVTKDEVLKIEQDALAGDYYEILQAVLQAQVSQRRKRNFLAYVRDGLIRFEVIHIDAEDAYEDDQPYEGMGQ